MSVTLHTASTCCQDKGTFWHLPHGPKCSRSRIAGEARRDVGKPENTTLLICLSTEYCVYCSYTRHIWDDQLRRKYLLDQSQSGGLLLKER